MFDFTPLTTAPLLWAAMTFVATYFGIHLVAREGWLRSINGHSQIYYAGAMVVAVTVLFAAFPLRAAPALLTGLAAAGFVVLIGGIWDDHAQLRPLRQLIFQSVAALCAVGGGWTIQYVSNPTGAGVIMFNPWVGGILAVAWLLLLMNALNWLDGVDGLAASVGGIAFACLAAVSLLPSVQDPRTLALALIGLAGVLGFLVWNFPPARVYLGTSGSWWLGLLIGVVAIGGGGKIVTTLLVLALPVVDVLLVSASRLLARQPLWQGDTVHHLHHRLLRHGFSHRTITLLAISVTCALGIGAIMLQTEQKLVALLVAAALFLVAGTTLALSPVRERWPNPKVIVAALLALVMVVLIISLAPKPCRTFTDGHVIAGDTTWSVAIADTAPERSRGLMECAHLPEDSGMYFVFTQPTTQAFWMKNMVIPIDIMWIRENKIIGIEREVPIPVGEEEPLRYYAPQPYDAVLEIEAGGAEKADLAVGQGVSLEEK